MKYYIFVTSKDHSKTLNKDGYIMAMQEWKIKKLEKGDKIIIYSSRNSYNSNEKYQQFTNYGTIIGDTYKKKRKYGLDFYAIDVKYNKTKRDVPIRPLLPKLDFIKKSKSWGLYLISGFREITKKDYELIKNKLT
jgi:predicted RNA-binding protein